MHSNTLHLPPPSVTSQTTGDGKGGVVHSSSALHFPNSKKSTTFTPVLVSVFIIDDSRVQLF